jgi:hypothetical protein
LRFFFLFLTFLLKLRLGLRDGDSPSISWAAIQLSACFRVVLTRGRLHFFFSFFSEWAGEIADIVLLVLESYPSGTTLPHCFRHLGLEGLAGAEVSDEDIGRLGFAAFVRAFTFFEIYEGFVECVSPRSHFSMGTLMDGFRRWQQRVQRRRIPLARPIPPDWLLSRCLVHVDTALRGSLEARHRWACLLLRGICREQAVKRRDALDVDLARACLEDYRDACNAARETFPDNRELFVTDPFFRLHNLRRTLLQFCEDRPEEDSIVDLVRSFPCNKSVVDHGGWKNAMADCLVAIQHCCVRATYSAQDALKTPAASWPDWAQTLASTSEVGLDVENEFGYKHSIRFRHTADVALGNSAQSIISPMVRELDCPLSHDTPRNLFRQRCFLCPRAGSTMNSHEVSMIVLIRSKCGS